MTSEFMNWEERIVTGWDEFSKCIDDFIKPRTNERNRFLFRGQADLSWKLISSFQRECRQNQIDQSIAYAVEQKALRSFTTQAHLYLESSLLPSEGNYLEWWQLMQHYRAPTRLLDWTKSLFVATYFAISEPFDKAGAIWVVEPGALHDRTEKSFPNFESSFDFYPSNNDTADIMFVEPRKPSNRMLAQQGWFSVSSHIFVDHSEIIDKYFENYANRRWTYKVIVPPELKPEFLKHLREMNITSSSLFPGADGLGRSIAEFIRLREWATW